MGISNNSNPDLNLVQILTSLSAGESFRLCPQPSSTHLLYYRICALGNRTRLAMHVGISAIYGDISRRVLTCDNTSRYESWKLIGLHPFCAILFTAGYALREYGSKNYLYSDQNLIVYILSQVFIYICP